MSGLVGGPGRDRDEELVYADIERGVPHFEESCQQFLRLTRQLARQAEWRLIEEGYGAVMGAADFTLLLPVLDGMVAAADRLIDQLRGAAEVEVAGATLARDALALKGFIRELGELA